MYGETGGSCSSDEFVKVEKNEINATETDDPRKGKDGQKQFCLRKQAILIMLFG
jgi:hypothetical protein